MTLIATRVGQLLRELVERRLEPAAREWLARTCAAAGAEPSRGALLETFTAATRRLGRSRLAPTEEEIARLAEAGVSWPISGDGAERQAVLRALPLLPVPERFLEIAVDACRSHIQPLFEAVACENPYPAFYFPELNFNQMVLKALFTGVALARILGLEGRITPELGRMAADYASERRAAGRSVPPDIGQLTGERGGRP